MNSAKSLDLLEIQSQLLPGMLDGTGDLVFFETIGSTNDWALEQCRNMDGLPKACIAERQLAGRGRNQRHWYSPHAQNIYMSYVREFSGSPDHLYGLGMIAGVCIVRVLASLGIRSGLKWPNDVYTDSGKIAGILVETRVKSHSAVCAVIGTGLNYDMGQSSTEIDTAWTDIQKELDGKCGIGRSVIVGRLLKEIISACEQLLEFGFESFRDEWQRNDLCMGKMLDVYEGDSLIQGRYLGINKHGALRLQVDEAEKVFYAADVSIRVKE
ncbi:MAG: biotin--[acetyl-CoA-carboxylase] ligase [Gammaproteobacteria bacterium]|nr:biotin--[acetyl-CoA-carboxylase] ligase [Gammaproteobacteria bacterium]